MNHSGFLIALIPCEKLSTCAKQQRGKREKKSMYGSTKMEEKAEEFRNENLNIHIIQKKEFKQ